LNKGVTVWFTGLSGAGKTTISKEVERQLRNRNLNVEVLDGDVLRKHLTSDLGFSKEDRKQNVRRAAYVAKLLTRNDVIVLASFISPYEEMRRECREAIGSFVEVYVKCSIKECIRRDVKGLYKKALDGEIERFTGITDPFEEPLNPEVTVHTDKETVEESAAKVITYLEQNGYFSEEKS